MRLSPLHRLVTLAATGALILSGATLSASAAVVPPAGAAAGGVETSTPAEPVTVEIGPLKARRTYIIQLDKASVPARIAQAGSSRRTPSASAWRSTLKTDQSDFRAAMADELGTTVKVIRSWTEAVNGFSATLTGIQAQKVAELPGVRAVTVDEPLELQSTSNGADLIKADSLWTGTASSGMAAKGEGMLIGIIDSGINPQNRSFAASVSVADGGDGYVVQNPRGAGRYLGVCDPASPQYVEDWGCTDKLIGGWKFEGMNDGSDWYDNSGHGTHTASTAAGNQVRAAWPGTDVLPTSNVTTDPDSGLSTVISGVAPHANLISYDVCTNNCPTSATVSAYNQAILDGVDVINFSIGAPIGGISDPWSDPVAQAQLSARKAGISVAGSAGNNGSAENSISSYGDVPWVTSVANTSHDLSMTNGSITFTTAAGGATSLGRLTTATISQSLPAATSIVQAAVVDTVSAGQINDGYCLPGSLPAAAVSGKVVVCDRGNNARVNKGRVVAEAGGVGMILLNAANGQGLLHDIHLLPTAHLTFAQGTSLKSLLGTAPTTRATIVGGAFTRDAAKADIVNISSSRGPTRNGSYGIGPSLAAPGTDVLAAGGQKGASSYEVMTGTSMAAPHVAGSMALLKQVHPTWTDAEIQSALMTTATTEVKDFDGTAATWFEMGSGRIDLSRATKAGLVLDTPASAYDDANPASGGDLRTVNSAQIANQACAVTCSMTRTFTATEAGLGTWTASVTSDSPATVALSVDHPTLTLTQAGQNQALTVTARTTAPTADAWYTGTLRLTPPAGSDAPPAHLPIIVSAIATSVALSDVTTAAASGSAELGTVVAAAAGSDLTFVASQPSLADQISFPVDQDPTPAEPFNADGLLARPITVPVGTKALVISLDASTASDLDLFVGTDAVTADTVRCSSTSAGVREQCVIPAPAPGQWWMVAQNYASSAGGVDQVRASIALVTSTEESDSLQVNAADPQVTPGLRQRLGITWDEPILPVGSVGFVAIDVTTPGLGSITGYVRVAQLAPEEPVRVASTLTLSVPTNATTAEKPTVAVTVTSTLATKPTGTVRFLVGGRVVATRPLNSGVATYALGGLAIGTHTLTAVYDGDVRHLASASSAPRTLTITAAPVLRKAVTITAKPQATVRKGKKAKPLAVRVKAVGVAPRGRVTVTVKGAGRQVARKASVSASGLVKIALPRYRKSGKVTVKVVYAGDTWTLPRTLVTSFTVRKR